MLGMRHIDWVESLLVPWIIFFALAAVASAFSILSKLHFFVGKMRSNFARRVYLSASAVTVNDALAQNDFNTRKIYAYGSTCTAARASVRRRARCKPHGTFQAGTWSSGFARRVSRRAGVAHSLLSRYASADAMTFPPSWPPGASRGVSALTALFATSRK